MSKKISILFIAPLLLGGCITPHDKSKSEVTADYWNTYIYNLGYFKNECNFTMSAEVTNNYNGKTIGSFESYFDHGKNDLGTDYGLWYLKDNSYYSYDGSVWSKRTEEDYFLIVSWFIMPVKFNEVKYDDNLHAYCYDKEDPDNDFAVNNYQLKFEGGTWKSLEMDVKTQMTDYHWSITTSDWGSTKVALPSEPSVNPTPEGDYELLRLNGSNQLNEYNDETTRLYDNIEIEYKRTLKGIDGSKHVCLDKGGSLTLETKITDLSKIYVKYKPLISEDQEIFKDVKNHLRFKSSNVRIKNPHQGGKDINSETLVSIEGSFFSLYATHTPIEIESIIIYSNEDIRHQDATSRDDVTLFFINDLHGHADYYNDFESGLVSMVDDFKALEQANPEGTIALSIGDQYQGTALSNMSRGYAVADLMNEVGFDAQIVGNHEFDWGVAAVEDVVNQNTFETLGINVMSESTNQRLDFLGDKLLLNKNGHKIGVIGSAGNCYESIAETMRSSFYFSQDSSLIKNASTELRNAGAEFIILMIHGDSINTSDVYDTSWSSQGYVDLVLDGHTHQYYAEQDAYGVYHIQAGQYSERYGKVTIDFANKNNGKPTVTPTIVNYYQYSDSKDYTGATLMSKHYELLDNVPNEIVASNARAIDRYETLQLVSDLYYDYLISEGEQILAKYGISDSVIATINYPYGRKDLPSGRVIYEDVYQAFPFDNPIGVAAIEGRYLISRAIENGSYAVSPSTLTSNQIDENKVYYVICDSYNYGYSTNHMSLVEEFDFTYLKDRPGFENLRDDPSPSSKTKLYARDMVRMAYLDGRFNN